MTELCSTMKNHGSDKGLDWHNYTVLYDHLFQDHKDSIANVFELGLGSQNTGVFQSTMKPGQGYNPGASHRGWRDYFINANVWGGDIDPDILFSEDRIECFQVDQTDPDSIKAIMRSIFLEHSPNLVCFTIPFPGNLFAALRCSQFIKQFFPDIKIAFGGGYCNTELRSLSDPRIFDYVDFISLDDGEGPLLKIVHFLERKIDINQLERTFVLEKNKVVYKNKTPNTIFHHKNLPVPNYVGLPFHKYVSFLDVVNPMHRMWTDARWNKLTISHGCYWKQCSFCDVTLDYIGNYQNTTADDLVNKIEQIMQDTGITGFHFVDEAAPPALMREVALEILPWLYISRMMDMSKALEVSKWTFCFKTSSKIKEK